MVVFTAYFTGILVVKTNTHIIYVLRVYISQRNVYYKTSSLKNKTNTNLHKPAKINRETNVTTASHYVLLLNEFGALK